MVESRWGFGGLGWSVRRRDLGLEGMSSFDHGRLLRAISSLEKDSLEKAAISDWILAGPHLSLLQENSRRDEVIIHALAKNAYINTVVVPNEDLLPLDREDLLRWSCDPYSPIASYVSGGPKRTTWIERGARTYESKSLERARTLVFGRTFHGWSKPGSTYYELNQEYSHLTEIHWRPEERAYCRYDANGDLEPIVSITTGEESEIGVTLVSFKWQPLEEYLAVSNSSLVRMFDFTMRRGTSFAGWDASPEEEKALSEDFFFRRKVSTDSAAYTRGVQILRIRREREEVVNGISAGWFGSRERDYAEFIAHDWRNGVVTKISTSPGLTANYFNAEGNSLPFETSPAFFRPEVLLKYKTDKDKYLVGERDISCRTAWQLKAFDVNEAGQVHAYICYLRDLPHNEQLHWQSFNEAPKAGISKRAIQCDFEGKFTGVQESLQRVVAILRKWKSSETPWWSLRDERLMLRVSTPLTSSQDEWADSFLGLSKMVVEGFELGFIRKELEKAGLPHTPNEKALVLTEKLLRKRGLIEQSDALSGMRMVQRVRNLLSGHANGHEAHQIVQDTLLRHGSFSNHFRSVCTEVANELGAIEALFHETRKAFESET